MHGSQLWVAYQGVPGANFEVVIGKAYPNYKTIPCDQFKMAFQAVEPWIADRAVLLIENSLGDSIHRNYDLLLLHRLHIVSKCKLTLTKLGLNVACEAVNDTAGAAEFVIANNLRDSQRTRRGSLRDEHLTDGIQDNSSNVTRFIMLAREPIIPRTDCPFKMSNVFAHDKGTSVLFKVLSAFAFRNISLTKI
ncbi:arogenate dehydratase/prephenate dehydratase 6 [Quercus suber]|uniref:Arogenate dehydratase/prephenate dehydratase 6 n=1 Tax=Quercus suber TaxID=58331 RepID=A0AAW0KFX8_QUESU|nr:arogenate dehydratase/prephenate dehydratase 6, chloroplastic [Quercus suber]